MPLGDGFGKQTLEDSSKIHLFGESSQLHGNRRGWLPSPGRTVDFNTQPLGGWAESWGTGGWSLYVDGLAESFWGAATVAPSGLCGFGAPGGHN